MIFVVNKRRKLDKIQSQYPEADILDVTSTSDKRYAQILSPFYPHGNIPIPLDSNGLTSLSVEGIWQGLKVFETEDVCFASFENGTMKNLKRTVRKHGKPLGHRAGVYGKELLGYFDARMKIYLPSYKWVLENVPEVKSVVARITDRCREHDVVFLDYDTNIDFRDTSSPLSHAGLIKMYIEGTYPNDTDTIQPLTQEEIESKKEQKKSNKSSKETELPLFK